VAGPLSGWQTELAGLDQILAPIPKGAGSMQSLHGWRSYA